MTNLTREQKLALLTLCKTAYENDKAFVDILNPIFHSPKNELQYKMDNVVSSVVETTADLLEVADGADLIFWWLYENNVGGVWYDEDKNEHVCDSVEKFLDMLECGWW